MAKAHITLNDGTKVQIEGNAEEVATLLTKFSKPSESIAPSKKKNRTKRTSTRSSKMASKTERKGPQTLIEELVDENYFKSKRTLNDVQKKLEELGHIYAITTLSPCFTRLTRKRKLRRIKEKKNWVYVT